MAYQLLDINATHLHFYCSSKIMSGIQSKVMRAKKARKKLSRDKVINRMKLGDKCNFGNIQQEIYQSYN